MEVLEEKELEIVQAQQKEYEEQVNAELIHETTKLFWRTNEKVELSLYECDSVHVLCAVGCAPGLRARDSGALA